MALFPLLLVLQTTGGAVYASDYDARLDWAELYFVSFPLDGGIKHVHVRPGEKVSKGAILVELDKEPIEIRISQYEAELAASKPVLADAKREFEQAQSLYEQTVLADDELQRARHAYEKASAELAASRATLAYARWQLKKTSLVAPWQAWVVERNVEPGQMLVAEQRSKPQLVLARAGVMLATAVLPLSAANSIAIGQKAAVKVGDSSFPARVSSIAMHADSAEQEPRYRIDAEFTFTTDDVYLAGQDATVSLP